MLILRSLLVLTLLGYAAPGLALSGLARVIDGDTVDVAGRSVRLVGIDAPEAGQSCDRAGVSWGCGLWSGQMLEQVVQGKVLTCEVERTDRYGRDVALCHAGAVDVGQAMVLAGAALAYRRYSDRYVEDETDARAASRGIWASRMVTPEAHRRPLATADTAAPSGCAIKGNISSSGRIFHQPGQRDYAATRIAPSKGEQWFCTASQARAAGFRAAKR